MYAQGRLVGFRGLVVRAWQPQRHLNGRQSRHTSASSFADISTELQKASCLQISQRKSSAGEVPGRQGMTWQLQHTPAPSFAHKFTLLHKASCLPISQWGSEAGEAAGKQGMKREKFMVVEMTTCQNARLLPHLQRPPPRRTPRSIRRCLQLSGWPEVCRHCRGQAALGWRVSAGACLQPRTAGAADPAKVVGMAGCLSCSACRWSCPAGLARGAWSAPAAAIQSG